MAGGFPQVTALVQLWHNVLDPAVVQTERNTTLY